MRPAFFKNHSFTTACVRSQINATPVGKVQHLIEGVRQFGDGSDITRGKMWLQKTGHIYPRRNVENWPSLIRNESAFWISDRQYQFAAFIHRVLTNESSITEMQWACPP